MYSVTERYYFLDCHSKMPSFQDLHQGFLDGTHQITFSIEGGVSSHCYIQNPVCLIQSHALFFVESPPAG